MKKIPFDVKIAAIKKVHELPGSWSNEDYLQILQSVNYDDAALLDPTELRDYTIMALQDLQPEEAAAVVLNYKFGSQLKPGQIENLSHEMLNEKLWEEYQEISLHLALYNCHVMMKAVFPKKFPETKALEVRLLISTPSEPYKRKLLNGDKDLLIRIIAQGLGSRSVINRLFDEQLESEHFAEAAHIIWTLTAEESAGDIAVNFHSSSYWLHDLETAADFQATIGFD